MDPVNFQWGCLPLVGLTRECAVRAGLVSAKVQAGETLRDVGGRTAPMSDYDGLRKVRASTTGTNVKIAFTNYS